MKTKSAIKLIKYKHFKKCVSKWPTNPFFQQLKLSEKFGDSSSVIFNDEVEKLPNYPIILFNSVNYWVNVDNFPICATDNVKIAVLCLVMAYEVFSLKVPNDLKNTLNYFLA